MPGDAGGRERAGGGASERKFRSQRTVPFRTKDNSGLIYHYFEHSGAAYGQDETLAVDDHNHTWMSGPGDRIALAAFFIGVALLAIGVAMYVVMYFA